MRRPGRRYATALALASLLTGIFHGCAADRECGFGGCPGDADITARVTALLAQHPALQAPNLLQVQTRDHVVYLSGLVDTVYEQRLAESVALQAPGVSKVVNSIGLSGSR
jgi:osmotically-inducible protein OsmY